MRKLLLASALAAVPLAGANAIQIINAAQTSGSNTVVATETTSMTATNINITDAVVNIAQILGLPGGIAAFLDLNANSTDSVTTVGGALLQHYSGTFSITSGAGDTGTNYLSGTFTDAAFGLQTGDQLSVNIANPPDTLSLTSTVIAAAELNAPSSLTFAFSNLSSTAPFSGGLQADGNTIAPFTASFVATADASSVPEPASLALLATGLLTLGLVRARRS